MYLIIDSEFSDWEIKGYVTEEEADKIVKYYKGDK